LGRTATRVGEVNEFGDQLDGRKEGKLLSVALLASARQLMTYLGYKSSIIQTWFILLGLSQN
jgi:hypothetical protein